MASRKMNAEGIDDIMSRAIQRAKLLKYINDNLSYEAMARDYNLAPTGVNRIINGISYPSLTLRRREELAALRGHVA